LAITERDKKSDHSLNHSSFPDCGKNRYWWKASMQIFKKARKNLTGTTLDKLLI
jgi:hypothetical protein